jgi:hypothetical protein
LNDLVHGDATGAVASPTGQVESSELLRAMVTIVISSLTVTDPWPSQSPMHGTGVGVGTSVLVGTGVGVDVGIGMLVAVGVRVGLLVEVDVLISV